MSAEYNRDPSCLEITKRMTNDAHPNDHQWRPRPSNTHVNNPKFLYMGVICETNMLALLGLGVGEVLPQSSSVHFVLWSIRSFINMFLLFALSPGNHYGDHGNQVYGTDNNMLYLLFWDILVIYFTSLFIKNKSGENNILRCHIVIKQEAVI